LTGEAPPPFSFKRMVADVFRTIRLEILKVLVYVAVVGPMFLASFFLPGLGQVISLLGFALTGSTSASTTSIGPPLAATGPFETASRSAAGS